MVYTFEELIRGNQEVLQYYKNGVALWDELTKEIDWTDIAALARRLGDAQSTFESRCGGRGLGYEVMVISGFARLYETGPGYSDTNRARARALAKAFSESWCSGEVKFDAERAAGLYHATE